MNQLVSALQHTHTCTHILYCTVSVSFCRDQTTHTTQTTLHRSYFSDKPAADEDRWGILELKSPPNTHTHIYTHIPYSVSAADCGHGNSFLTMSQFSASTILVLSRCAGNIWQISPLAVEWIELHTECLKCQSSVIQVTSSASSCQDQMSQMSQFQVCGTHTTDSFLHFNPFRPDQSVSLVFIETTDEHLSCLYRLVFGFYDL